MQPSASGVSHTFRTQCPWLALVDGPAAKALVSLVERQPVDVVVSEGTVKTHLSHIYRKVGCSNRTELLQDFWKRG